MNWRKIEIDGSFKDQKRGEYLLLPIGQSRTGFAQFSMCIGLICMLIGIDAVRAQDGAAIQEEGRAALTPVDFVEIPRLKDPQLSPDGNKVLYISSHVDWSLNRRVSQYKLIDVEQGWIDIIPDWEKEGHSLSTPAWSPNGDGFATLLERENDGHAVAYFYDIEKKALEPLASHSGKMIDIKWGKDGKGLYFRSRRDDGKSKDEEKLDIRPFDVSLPYELWHYDLATKKSEMTLGGDYSVRNYTISDDGELILHSRIPEGAIFESKDSELWLYDRAQNSSVRLTNNDYRESDAKLSPDGTAFAFIATVNESGEGYYEDNLFVQNIGSSDARLLLPDEPMEILDFAWEQDGDAIFILGNIGVRTELFRLSLENQQLERLSQGDHALKDWSFHRETGSHITLISDAKSPGEVYLKSVNDRAFRKISSEYGHWSESILLPEQTVFKWQARDGTALEGLLVKPIGYEAERSYPLVTITHGGPRSSAQFGAWNASRYIPVLAGQGYAVFLPNHRGGTGYGDAFMRDMVGNYFNNAHLDVLDGIDALTANGIADPDRLIKMGWSAGGHMTNKLITITDQFKAASSGAGASEWISMYAESDVRHNRTPWFGGAPWQKDAPIQNYVAQSVIKDTWRVKTPTLFFNGADDERVPPTQAIMMYRGVRATGTPTRLYLAPKEPHNYRKPIHQLFKINTELAWYARYALQQDYTATLPVIGSETVDSATGSQAEQNIPVES